MSDRVTMRDAELSDCARLAEALRPEDRAEVAAVAEQPEALLVRLWRDSVLRRTVLVDGELAAMWGCNALGQAWLLTATPAQRVPLAFFKMARAGCQEMLQNRSALISSVAASYTKSIRFMEMLGFKAGPPYPVHPTGVLFRTLRLERE